MPPFRSFNAARFTTTSQALDAAVASYWQRRYPGKPGRVILVDRTVRKAAA